MSFRNKCQQFFLKKQKSPRNKQKTKHSDAITCFPINNINLNKTSERNFEIMLFEIAYYKQQNRKKEKKNAKRRTFYKRLTMFHVQKHPSYYHFESKLLLKLVLYCNSVL